MQVWRSTSTMPSARLNDAPVGQTSTQGGSAQCWHITGTEEALRVTKLNRGKAVRDVSFVLRKGEILGFAGLMGAGRTEVARAIFGADTPDSGEIFIHGQKRRITSMEAAYMLNFGPRMPSAVAALVQQIRKTAIA